MYAKSQVLAAFPPSALATLARIVETRVALVPAASMAQARAIMNERADLALVLCGVHFDESRMFDLLRYSRRNFPRLPFVCCRFLDWETATISPESIGIAAASLGASAFVDYPTLAASLGPERAAEQVRTVVLAQLPV